MVDGGAGGNETLKSPARVGTPIAAQLDTECFGGLSAVLVKIGEGYS